MDALFLAVLDQGVILQQEGVALDLVGGGDNASGVDDSLEVLDGEVGNANGADLGLGEGDQGCDAKSDRRSIDVVSPFTSQGSSVLLTLPGVDEGDALVEGHILAILCRREELVVASLGEGHGPVDEVQLRWSALGNGGGTATSGHARQGSRGRAPAGSGRERARRAQGGES